MAWRILDHTADIGLVVEEKNLSRAFATAAEAMFRIMIDGELGSGEEREIHLEASDPGALLVDFLSELLFLFDTEGFVVSSADVRVEKKDVRGKGVMGGGEKKWSLIAILRGEKFSRDRHAIAFEIKAVTYHMLDVSEDGRITVLFDI